MVIRAKDQASRVINGMSRSMSSNFRRIESATSLAARESAIKMAQVRQNYAQQILGQQKTLNTAMKQGNTVRAASSRQAIRDMRLMQQEEVLGIRSQQIAQQQILHTARVQEEARAAAIDSKKAAAQTAGQWIAVGAGMVLAGTMGIRALGSMVRGAVEYQRQAALTLTQVSEMGHSIKELQGISSSVARSVGVPIMEMQDALYDIFSSTNVSVKDSQVVLRQFAMAAVAGQVSIGEATGATISIMNGFHKTVGDINHILDVQFEAVRLGRMTYGQFAAAIGKAIPSAVAADQAFETLAGSMAFLTRAGLTAAQSAISFARLSDLFTRADVPTELKKLGIEAFNANGKMRPLNQLLSELAVKFKPLQATARAELFKQIFGGAGTIQARRFFNLAINGADELNYYINKVKVSTGTFQRAYGIMANTAAVRTQVLKNRWKDFTMSLGNEATPVFTTLVNIGIKFLGLLQKLTPGQRHVIVQTMAFTSAIVALMGILIAIAGTIKLVSSSLAILQLTSGGVAARFITTRVATSALAQAFSTAAVGSTSLAAGLGGLAAVLLIAANAEGALTKAQEIGANIHQRYIRPLAEHLGLADKTAGAEMRFRAATADSAAAMYSSTQASVAAARQLGGYGASITEAVTKNKKFAGSVQEVNKELEEQRQKAREASAEIVSKGISGLADQQDKIAEATRRLRDAQADLAKTQRGTTSAVSSYSPALERVHDASVRVEKAQISLADKAKDTRIEHIRLREAQHDLTVAQGRARESNGKSVASNDELKAAVQRVRDAEKDLKTATGETAREVFKRFKDEEAAAKNWSANMRTLLRRGMDPGLVAELAKEGPVHMAKFVSLSKKQIANLSRAWRDRNFEMERATDVLTDAAMGDVSKYVRGAKLNMAGLKRAWKDMTHDQRVKVFEAMIKSGMDVKKFQRVVDALHGKKIAVQALAKVVIGEGTKLFLKTASAAIRERPRAAGGPITGPGTGTSDSISAAGPGGTRYRVSNGEHVWTAREVANAGGHRNVEALRAQFRAAGGPIGDLPKFNRQTISATERMGQRAANLAARVISKGLTAFFKQFDMPAGGQSWKWLWAQVHSHFPRAKLLSAFRPGARTHATGRLSYHARGQAIDVSPSMAIFNWIARTFGPRTQELIFSPAGRRQIHNGRQHMYTGVTRADHWNHVHWAMRGFGLGPGGTRPGGSVGNIVRSVAARYRWSTGAQWSALSQLISHESGWNPLAQNPRSSAFGLFQFLNGTWRTVGGHKTADPFLQSVYGLRYILQRYNTPTGAWSFWRRHRYYHQGGQLPEDIFGVGSSGNTYSMQRGETVSPRGGGGGGDIHIHFHGPVYGGKAGAQELVDVVVQGIAKKARTYGGTVNVTANRRGAPVIR